MNILCIVTNSAPKSCPIMFNGNLCCHPHNAYFSTSVFKNCDAEKSDVSLIQYGLASLKRVKSTSKTASILPHTSKNPQQKSEPCISAADTQQIYSVQCLMLPGLFITTNWDPLHGSDIVDRFFTQELSNVSSHVYFLTIQNRQNNPAGSTCKQ